MFEKFKFSLNLIKCDLKKFNNSEIERLIKNNTGIIIYNTEKNEINILNIIDKNILSNNIKYFELSNNEYFLLEKIKYLPAKLQISKYLEDKTSLLLLSIKEKNIDNSKKTKLSNEDKFIKDMQKAIKLSKKQEKSSQIQIKNLNIRLKNLGLKQKDVKGDGD